VRYAAALVLAACSIAAGCGGSSSAQEEPGASTSGNATTSVNGQTLEQLWRAPGEDVAIVPGTADFGPGKVRFTFLVIDGQGRVVTRPTAKVWLAKQLKAEPFAQTTAKSEPIGVNGNEPGEPQAVFVSQLDVEERGADGRPEQVLGGWAQAPGVDRRVRVVLGDHPGEQRDQAEQREQRRAHGRLAVGPDGAHQPPQARPSPPCRLAGGRRLRQGGVLAGGRRDGPEHRHG